MYLEHRPDVRYSMDEHQVDKAGVIVGLQTFYEAMTDQARFPLRSSRR